MKYKVIPEKQHLLVEYGIGNNRFEEVIDQWLFCLGKRFNYYSLENLHISIDVAGVLVLEQIRNESLYELVTLINQLKEDGIIEEEEV